MARPLLTLRFAHLTVGTALLALTGLLSCLLLSLLFHNEESTRTRCAAPHDNATASNYLPSVSASVRLAPERYVWRTVIGFLSAQRYLASACYFAFYRQRFSDSASPGRPPALPLATLPLASLALVCSLAENTALLLLAYVSSAAETYAAHEKLVFAFNFHSLLYMLSTCALWRGISRRPRHGEEVTSYRWKRRLFLFNAACCLGAAYCFRRHAVHCEPGVYSVFAGLQYAVVASNVAFHMTAFWDFGKREAIRLER